MRRRARIDPRRAKKHRCYTVAEAARLFDAHRNTVRAWIKAGLRTLKPSGELLIAGADLSAFLARRQAARKRKTPPGSIYCVKCREPREPDAGSAVVLAIGATQGNIRAPCPICGSLMNQRANLAKLAANGFAEAPIHAGGAALRR